MCDACVCVRARRVEFQSKFYKGDGYLFEPFRFGEVGSLDDLTIDAGGASNNNKWTVRPRLCVAALSSGDLDTQSWCTFPFAIKCRWTTSTSAFFLNIVSIELLKSEHKMIWLSRERMLSLFQWCLGLNIGSFPDNIKWQFSEILYSPLGFQTFVQLWIWSFNYRQHSGRALHL